MCYQLLLHSFFYIAILFKSVADKILLQRQTHENITQRLIPLYNYNQQSFLFRKLTDTLSYVLPDPHIFFRNFL